MDTYTPGLHLLTTFAAPVGTLTDMIGCQALFDKLIVELDLVKMGETYHAFPTGGFTAVVCLSESHVSIHTWPEFGIATFDVFLSNFQRDNEAKVRTFYAQTLLHFQATEQTRHELAR